MSRSPNTIVHATLLATVLVLGGAAAADGASPGRRAHAAADGCVTHPHDPSRACTRSAGKLVEVCDRDPDGHAVYAEVQTTASYPAAVGKYHDDNSSKAGCSNHTFQPGIIAVRICVNTQGCSAFLKINEPPAPKPPPAPAPRPVPNGTGGSRLARLTLRFTSTGAGERGMRFATSPTVSGQLRDERGVPIAGATLAVLARPRQAGAGFFGVATVTTAPDGTFRYRFGPGPSRTLKVAYTAFPGDAKPAAQLRLRTRVRATLTAHARPRRTRAGRRVRVSGRLLQLPRPGIQVTVQARDRGVWRSIGQARTHGDGTFTWPYRFKRTAAGRTFALRALVDSPIYPFARGHSPSVRVRVRG